MKQTLERIAGHDVHPAASRFPLMDDGELKELAADIQARGLDTPIRVYKGQVIDGRNRLLACERAGVSPVMEEWDGRGGSVAGFILAANVKRRHLTQGQRAMIAVDLLPSFQAEARERQRAAGGKKQKGKKAVSAPVREPDVDQLLEKSAAVAAAALATETALKASQAAAKAAGVGSRYVETAKAVAAKDPDLAKKVRQGEITLKRAEKIIRRSEQAKEVAAYTPPEGSFQVIVADPPWPFDDQLEGSDEARGGLPYPSMTVEEICALRIPADKDCILWLWTTNAHLVDGTAPRVLAAWGFEPKTLLTWDKQRMGAGRWLRGVTEHCILAVRGNPLVTLTNETTLLSEAKRQHSRKPEGFFRMGEQLCPSRARLEMFARAPREGWVTSGSERNMFAPSARLPVAHVKVFRGSRARKKAASPQPSEAEVAVAASLAAWTEGKPHICAGCGGSAGRGLGMSGGMKDGKYGLPICWSCDEKGVPRAYVDEEIWLKRVEAK